MRLRSILAGSTLFSSGLVFIACGEGSPGNPNAGTAGTAGGVGATSGGTAGSGASTGGSGGTATAGSATGGSAVGGSAVGGSATGGAGNGGSAAGGAGNGGSSGAGAATGGSAAGGSSGAGSASGGSATGGAGNGGSSGAGVGGAAGGAVHAVYNPEFVEFYGADCQVDEPQDVNISTLPDLFANFAGSTMSKKSDWRCRRAELKRAVEKYVHGDKPGRPEIVTGSVSTSAIKVHVEHMGKSADFSVSITLPSGATGPVPAMIGLGGGSLSKSILMTEGVASINYDNYAISDENTKGGVFTNIYGMTPASSQIAWAWGVSRIIDVLVDERDAGRNDIIDPTGIGVTGCSRLGKGAFTIGAFDERIALGVPQESGTAGVSAYRIVNTAPVGPNGKPAETLQAANGVKGWFGTVFGTYIGKVNTIPVDTSSMVAMYAPRGLLVLDNSRIGELCGSCQHGATAAGAKVYEALGVEKNVAYNGGNPSDPHNHCSFYEASQGEPLRRAIRAHLTKKAPADGRLEPQPAGTADLAEWIPWSAPALADDVRWDSPPLTSK